MVKKIVPYLIAGTICLNSFIKKASSQTNQDRNKFKIEGNFGVLKNRIERSSIEDSLISTPINIEIERKIGQKVKFESKATINATIPLKQNEELQILDRLSGSIGLKFENNHYEISIGADYYQTHFNKTENSIETYIESSFGKRSEKNNYFNFENNIYPAMKIYLNTKSMGFGIESTVNSDFEFINRRMNLILGVITEQKYQTKDPKISFFIDFKSKLDHNFYLKLRAQYNQIDEDLTQDYISESGISFGIIYKFSNKKNQNLFKQQALPCPEFLNGKPYN